MKNTRCVIIAVLVVAICFSMVSCGNKKSAPKKDEQEQRATESIKEEGSTEITKEETTENNEQQKDAVFYCISRIIERNSNGEIYYTVTAEYDDVGKPLLYSQDCDGEDGYTAEFKYNEHGLLESLKYFGTVSGDFEIQLTNYSYDIDGNVMKEVISDEDGFCYCYEYSYNKNDKTIEKYEQKENGELYLSMIRHYNYDKQLVSEEFYQEDGTPGFKRVYSYNSKGDVTSYQGIDHRGMQLFLYEYENTYNEKNELIKVKTVEHGDSGINTRNTREYAYDAHGNLVSETIIGRATDTAVRYEWTYDDNGNILSEALYRVQDDEYTYKREFSYVAYNGVQSQKGQAFDITQMLVNYGIAV